MTSGPSTGPNLQPLVYTSFNQNQVKIDKNTGALNTTYPIVIPPGRNGLQPNLDLVYNSQNIQQGSIFGEGWSIGIPYIERLNKAGIDQLYSTSTLNYFTSSLDGELVATTTVTSTASSYVARTENGAFNRYAFSSSTDAWTVTDKNGTQYTFGSTSDSQQSDPSNSAHVFKWMLKQVTDANSNAVTYNYFKDSGQIYPSSTFYTGNGSSTGMFEVDFQRAASTDNATSSATGFPMNTNYRISEIDAKVNGMWVRKYVLGYTPGDNGYTALLGSVAASGENASGTVVSLPSSTFAYQLQTPGWASSSTWNPPAPFVSSSSMDNGLRIANLTGNGLPGIISSGNAWVDTGSGWVSSSTWVSPVSFTTGSGGDNGYRILDVNGDGLPDIVSCGGSYINTGAGWTSSSTWNSPVCYANSGVSTGAIVADVNGDGLPDIVTNLSSSTSSSTKGFQVDANGTLTANLTSYYPMEGGSSDYYGSNNGTDTSMTYGTGYGKVNKGALLNGTSGKVDLGNSSYDLNATDFSFAFWVKFASSADGQTLIAKDGGSGPNPKWDLWYGIEQSGHWDFTTDSGPKVDLGAQTLDTTAWHQYVLTKSGTSYKWYYDGSLLTSTTSSNAISKSATDIFLGWGEGSGSHFDGNMDEAGWWTKALSTQEISDLYNGGSGQTMATVTVTSSTAPSVNFVLAAPHVNFTFPTQGTSTPNFSNWQLNADTVTSTDSYSLTVNWNNAAGDSAQSSTINASGTQLLAGVNVPKPTSSLDYTWDGTPVVMNATGTLYSATSTIATSSVSFTEQTTVAPLNCGSDQIQCISYKYDNDGNVTQVTDQSATNAAITVSYTYDSLNRLLTASSSNAASGQNYLQTFSYDPVGNILAGPAGTYSYQGTNFTDPDAVTRIVNGTSTTAFTYDNNGNLTNASSGYAYTWDYRNELLTASSSNATSTYGYDFLTQRVKVANGTSTTYYPETTYNVTGSTTIKHIFFDGLLLATVTNAPSSSAALRYVSDDMLGGANDVTNASGTLVETTQYFPYGSIRIDNTFGSYSGEARKYIGQLYDAATSLSYLNARYYSGAQGQFLSEDPVFLGVPSQQNLSTPQSLNAYSYAEDNPINRSDATGKYVEEISQPIMINGFNIGYNHAFLYVVPEPGENLTAISSNNSTIDTSQPFTLSGEPSAQWGGTLNFIANNPYDYGTASNQASVPGVARVRVGPPNGMTSSMFDASVVSGFNNLSQGQWVYNYIGSRQVTGGGNSNNANTTLLENAGVTSRQMNSIQTQMASQGAHSAPGLGGSLNSPTPLQATLSALSSALNSLSSLLSKL